MDIYAILSSKPHNKHYLDRYHKFIQVCRQVNSLKTKEELGYTEKHHICPRAKDMFPEYKSLKEYNWNCAVLSSRQHFIAHWMLWKAYGGSQGNAFWLMRNRTKTETRMTSTMYEKLAIELSIKSSMNGIKLSKEGRHNAQIEAKEGRHYWQSAEYAKRISEFAKINAQKPDFAFKRDEVRKSNANRQTELSKLGMQNGQLSVKNGTHLWLTEEHRQKTIARNKDPEFRKRNSKIILERCHRPIVNEIKEILKLNQVKAKDFGFFGNWTMKPDNVLIEFYEKLRNNFQ